jgi:chromosome partitioning protein
MIISFLQQKGGAGKSMLSINVACALKELGKSVLLIDADPQATARTWHSQNDGTKLEVIGLDRPTIEKDLRQFKDRYDIIIIDSPGKLEDMIVKIIILSDVVFIPVQPAGFDIWATSPLVELIKQRRQITNGIPKVAFITNRKIVGTNIGKEVSGVLTDFELPVFESGACQRICYIQSSSIGETVLEKTSNFDTFTAAVEIRAIAQEILEFIA